MDSKENEIKQGRYGNLTHEQEETLEQFIYEIKENGLFCQDRHNIHLLLRFLRARNFDLKKTMAMFKACEDWRKEKNVDDIYKNFVYDEVDEVTKIYPKFYHNVDLQGRPIYIEQFAKLDVKKLFKISKEERLLTNFILDYEVSLNERFPLCSNAAGHHIETGFTIMDLKDVGVRQFARCFEFIKKTSKIASDNYPEIMGNLIVINAPSVFSMCWKLIKGILDPVTVSKINILGSHYQKELLSYVAPENLPKQYGGTCECEGGCQHSNVGPWNDYAQKENIKTTKYTQNKVGSVVKENGVISIDEFLQKMKRKHAASDNINGDETLNESGEDEAVSDESESEKVENVEENENKNKDKEIELQKSKSVLPSPPLTPDTLCSSPYMA